MKIIRIIIIIIIIIIKEFRLKPLWSHEMGATECVIAPQRPPVNTHADKQSAGGFPSDPTGSESQLFRQSELLFLELFFLKDCFLEGINTFVVSLIGTCANMQAVWILEPLKCAHYLAVFTEFDLNKESTT